MQKYSDDISDLYSEYVGGEDEQIMVTEVTPDNVGFTMFIMEMMASMEGESTLPICLFHRDNDDNINLVSEI